MIFAPRSCPSRPGLATTTRILRLDSGLSAAVSVVACINRDIALLEEGHARARAGAKRPDSTRRPAMSAFDRLPSAELALGQLLPQNLLVELADARLRHGADEGEVVGDPPLRDLPGEVLAKLLRRARGALREHH